MRSLIRVLESQFTESDASMFQVGEQRERNHRYYSLQPLGNEIKGRSHYISPDNFDVVEGKKAYMADTFLTGRQPVKFKPTGPQATQLDADQRTGYVQTQLKKNKWPRLFRDTLHDAYVAKRCVVLVEWDEDKEEYVQYYENAPAQQIQQQIDSDKSVVDFDTQELQEQVMPGPQGPQRFYTGAMTLIKDISQALLTLVQPERFFRDPHQAYIDDCAYAGYEEDLTRAEMVQRNYDPEQVSRINIEYRFRREEEDSQRKAHDRSWTRRRLHNRPKELETVTIFKTWTWLDLSSYHELTGSQPGMSSHEHINPEALKLYEIHWTRGEILYWSDGSPAIREASEMPFFEWTPHKISHAEHGLCVSDVMAHLTKTNSVLKRLIIDNQQIRNTSRYEAVQKLVKNPRELLDNSIGGVIWTRQQGAVTPLAAPELSPLTMNVIEMLNQDKEDRSGMSRLSQGMNTDVIRYQNAQDMIDKQVTLSNRRNAREARDYAETFFIPVLQYIYRLGVRNDQGTYQLEAQGGWHDVRPSTWEDSEWEMETHVALTPDEGQQLAQNLLMMHSMKMQDPQMQMIYGLEQKHALFDDVYDALGITDTSRYMMRLDSPQFKQVMQMQQAQQQKAEQMGMQMQQFQMWMAKSAEGREWYKAQLDGHRLQLDATDKSTDNDLNEAKFKHQKVIDFRELAIETQQKRAARIGNS